jgi:hypothetical protein
MVGLPSLSENQPAHVLEDVAELSREPGGQRAVDHAVVIGE